jgi:hypothetical protein
MTQDEMIEMAKRAGFFVKDSEAYSPSVQEDHELTPYVEIFAKLVAGKEREACATMSDWILKEGGGTWGDAIRARGQE